MTPTATKLTLLSAFGQLWLSDGRILSLDGDSLRYGRTVLPIAHLHAAVAPFHVVAIGEQKVGVEACVVATVSRDGNEPAEVVADTVEAANFLIACLS